MLSRDDIGKEIPSHTVTWDERDTILYALGVGASARELSLVYEGAPLEPLPTFGVILGFPIFSALGQVLSFDTKMTLHGRQRLELHQAIPAAGRAVSHGRVANIWDKGTGAVIDAAITTTLEDGTALCTNRAAAFVRNGGGFGGDRGPAAAPAPASSSTPDVEVDIPTSIDQAALYRLSGDRNPLHIDPRVAAAAGFDRPILHGLCSFGVVARGALGALDARPAALTAVEARFAGIVYPGETLHLQMWSNAAGYDFTVAVVERDAVVLDDGRLELA